MRTSDRNEVIRALRAAALVLAAPSGFATSLRDALTAYEAGVTGPLDAGDVDLSKVEFKGVIEVLKRITEAYRPGGYWHEEDVSKVPWLSALNDRQLKTVQRTFDRARELLQALQREEQMMGLEHRSAKGTHGQNVASLRAFLPQLKVIDKLAGSHERRSQHGPFVIVPMPGVTKAHASNVLEALDEAAELLRRRFSRLLYGDVYLKTTIRDNGRGAAAAYDFKHDIMQVNVKANHRVSDVFSIVHEFGHRYDNKFLSQELRDRFDALKVSISDYGATDARENFAEAFAFYVLNMGLPPAVKAIFEELP